MRVSRALPSLLDQLADDPAASGSDPYVALWDAKGLRAVVSLTSGMALYSREPYAEGYDRVAVACLDGPGRVWAVKPPNHAYWVLPGGHLEDGESPTAAAMREMREETGVSVTLGADLGVLHRPWARTRVYLGKRVGEPRQPTTPDEVVGVSVIDLADLDPSERVWLEPKLARNIEAWDPAEHPRSPAGDEHGGEFAEIGPGGPRVLYHGTIEKDARRILKKGFDLVDYPFLTSSLANAMAYAKSHIDRDQPGGEPVVLSVSVDQPHLTDGDRDGEYGYKKMIPASAVKRHQAREAWDPAAHPREPAGSEKGGEFSGAGGGKAYVRFGEPPKSGRSANYATGKLERGVSVYQATVTPEGHHVIDVPDEGEWAEQDLRDRIRKSQANEEGHTAYLVHGKIVGRGGDGEPLLKAIKIIGTIDPAHLKVRGDR